MKSPQHDLLVIGAGPGGYVAAIRAAQLGMDVACVEREPALGGTCLRVGCIPSKALLESSHLYELARNELAEHGVKTGKVALDLPTMMKRKDAAVDLLTGGIAELFKKGKVTRYQGHASFLDSRTVMISGGEELGVRAKHVIVATGSSSAPLPGVELDGDRICTSSEALAWDEVPGHLVVIGAGAIGLELGSVWRRLGSRVTVLEYLDRILPGMDAEVAREAQRILKRQGMKIELKQKVTGASLKNRRPVVEREGGEPVRCDRVLLATGRRPNTEGLALDKAGVELDGRGFVTVGENFHTSAAGIYAIGDVIGGAMLAHKAEDEGVACVEAIASGVGHVNYSAIPSVVYTEPEVAGVGATEEDLVQGGVPFRKGVFFFRGNSRARAVGRIDGRVKILAHAETDRVLGVHIVGSQAGELIAGCCAAMEFCASSEDIARTCHAHPTLAEAIKEAALAVDGRAIHA